jgi:murein DD-endopeptidase MepM/ murein hydrolase activator NlpD
MLKNKLLPKLGIVAQASARRREVSSKHRIVALSALASLFAVFTAVATVQDRAPIFASPVVEPLVPALTSLADTSLATYWYEERFGKGDTFAAMLARLRVDREEIRAVLADKTVGAVLALLRPGTPVQAEVIDGGKLKALRFVSSNDQLVGLDRTDEGFKLVDKSVRLARQIVARAAYVRSSLFAAADAAGVPDSVATQLGEVFGAEIDFQREFRRGDRFTVVFEMFYHQGRLIRPGRLLAAEVVHGKRTLRAVWFEAGDTHGYYSPSGGSLRSAFLRSPLEFSRITSGFEMRFDPRSRQWHAHKGIDYAAPIGTPVRATGDAIVEFVGPQAGYGNLVILKHRGDYQTLYAHLHNFADGLKQGARVAQGDVIGFVGQTGWATGPHLHYEFLIRGDHVDPTVAALPAARPLEGAHLAPFRAQAAPLLARLDLLQNTTLAAAD